MLSTVEFLDPLLADRVYVSRFVGVCGIAEIVEVTRAIRIYGQLPKTLGDGLFTGRFVTVVRVLTCRMRCLGAQRIPTLGGLTSQNSTAGVEIAIGDSRTDDLRTRLGLDQDPALQLPYCRLFDTRVAVQQLLRQEALTKDLLHDLDHHLLLSYVGVNFQADDDWQIVPIGECVFLDCLAHRSEGYRLV